MTQDLILIHPNDTFERVDKIFKEHNFHHLPVVDEQQKLVGILSKSDYLTLCDSFSHFNTPGAQTQNKKVFTAMLVGDVMEKNIARLKPNHTVMATAGYFRENLFHAIPVVDEQQKLVGLVTTFDLINLAYSSPVKALD